jgi:hypothetical protein
MKCYRVTLKGNGQYHYNFVTYDEAKHFIQLVNKYCRDQLRTTIESSIYLKQDSRAGFHVNKDQEELNNLFIMWDLVCLTQKTPKTLIEL